MKYPKMMVIAVPLLPWLKLSIILLPEVKDKASDTESTLPMKETMSMSHQIVWLPRNRKSRVEAVPRMSRVRTGRTGSS
jgi:hypothetical protein